MLKTNKPKLPRSVAGAKRAAAKLKAEKKAKAVAARKVSGFDDITAKFVSGGSIRPR